MRLKEMSRRLLPALRHGLSGAEPVVLFPALAIVLLGGLWVATVSLIRLEYAGTRATAVTTTRELTETYEAQIVRALREIDRTLKWVAYSRAPEGRESVLAALAEKGLLLPDFLFTVSIADADGNIRASTKASGRANIAGTDYFEAQRTQTVFAVGAPQPNPQSHDWTLSFSRRLDNSDGSFAGAVVIAVDAAYFVSAYEPARLGQRGFLGLLGTDGVFRISRSGPTVAIPEVVDYNKVVPETEADLDLTQVSLTANSWDGVRRYTATRALYEFPLAVIVGLSEEEQLQPAAARARGYVLRSSAASLALLALMAVLGRLSWQLQQSRKRAAQEQIEHAKHIQNIAHHDSLTGLPNRGYFSELLHQMLAQAKRYDRQLAVLFLDLDRFKLINDTLGHDAGDALLEEVARRLKQAVRESDVAARLGGDEFVVLLPEQCDEDSLVSVAHRVLDSISSPYNLLGTEFRVTVSVGISRYPEDAADEQSLLKIADIAMYSAKEKSGNNFQFYAQGGSERSLERLNLESALQQALERHEFSLHYQEQRDLKSDETTGMEALLRWEHPQLGLLLPLKFLPLAEETGLILPIGKWVIETACRDCVALQKESKHPLTMSVNLSARQFADENLPHDLANILKKTGVEPQLLELGVTESVLLEDADRAVQVLEQIRAQGVRVAIDNFGASYSSLSTLKRFHFDTVNIDGSVVRGYAHNPEDRWVTQAAITMGKSLAFTAVAEGVETEAQAQFLRDSDCDKAQGFYFGYPAPRNRDS
jgi:diguanylate cyclase (GGDEF)-like protein